MELPLLSLLIWLPILAAIMILFAGRGNGEQMKWFALIISLLELIVGLVLLVRSNSFAPMQFIEKHIWIERFDIYYALGVDAISVTLIVLTVFMTLLIVITSWQNVKTQLSHYLAAFLLLAKFLEHAF